MNNIPLSHGMNPAPSEWTEADICHYHLNLLREQYDRDAKPWIDRLVRIKQMERPSFVVRLPIAKDQGADK